MSTDTLVLERRPEPAPRRKAVSDGVMGILLFIFSEIMLFAGLISAFVIVKSNAAGQMWPPYGQPRLPVEATAINTAALLLSGVILLFAHYAWRRSEPRQALVPFGLAILLGVFFVGFQGVEWVRMLAQGLTLQSSPYGAFFYLIVGTHAVHAVGAIIALAWGWNRLRRGTLRESAFHTVQLFWYFVVLVWPFLYWKVYL